MAQNESETPSGEFVSTLELAAQPDAATWARSHTRDVLSCWRMNRESIETAELAVSELVANAVQHGRPLNTPATQRFTIRLVLRARPGQVRVEVYDPSNKFPRRVTFITPEIESGRGLFLLESITAKWGVTPYRHGKCVWCLIGRKCTTPRTQYSTPNPSG